MASVTGYTTAGAMGVLGFLPPVGAYLNVPGVTGYGYNSQGVGAVYFHPTWVPATMTVNAFRTKINSARSGGTGYIRKFGLYSDSNGLPNTANLLASVSVDDTTGAGGNGVEYSFTGVSLLPGRYWCASIVYYTAAPTSASTVVCVTGVTWGLAADNNNAPDVSIRGMKLDSQTDLPTSATAASSFGFEKSNSVPMLWLKRSA